MQVCGTASVVLQYLVSQLQSLVANAVAVALMQHRQCAVHGFDNPGLEGAESTFISAVILRYAFWEKQE